MTPWRDDAVGPLAGLRVIELGGIGPGPFCAMVLSDLGADVIRVHRSHEIDLPPNPVLDRGRRSLAVDLKAAAGADVVRRLAASADVLIEGFRPGVLERLGLAPDLLRRTNPRLVVGRMTGFGQTGPRASQAGHDITYLAQAGVLNSMGRGDDKPVPPLNLVGDFGGGGMLLAVGVLAAVHEAQRSGAGQDVDAAMVDGAALLMSMTHGLVAQGRWSATERGHNLFDGYLPHYDTYTCSDGRFIAVGALEPQFFAALVDGLDLAATVDATWRLDETRYPKLRRLFTSVFLTRPRDEWIRRFSGADACVAPVLSIAEVTTDTHLSARHTFVTDDAGVVHPAPAPRFSRSDRRTPQPPARPGAHTDEVLRGLGLEDARIAALHEKGIVA